MKKKIMTLGLAGALLLSNVSPAFAANLDVHHKTTLSKNTNLARLMTEPIRAYEVLQNMGDYRVEYSFAREGKTRVFQYSFQELEAVSRDNPGANFEENFALVSKSLVEAALADLPAPEEIESVADTISARRKLTKIDKLVDDYEFITGQSADKIEGNDKREITDQRIKEVLADSMDPEDKARLALDQAEKSLDPADLDRAKELVAQLADNSYYLVIAQDRIAFIEEAIVLENTRKDLLAELDKVEGLSPEEVTEWQNKIQAADTVEELEAVRAELEELMNKGEEVDPEKPEGPGQPEEGPENPEPPVDPDQPEGPVEPEEPAPDKPQPPKEETPETPEGPVDPETPDPDQPQPPKEENPQEPGTPDQVDPDKPAPPIDPETPEKEPEGPGVEEPETPPLSPEEARSQVAGTVGKALDYRYITPGDPDKVYQYKEGLSYELVEKPELGGPSEGHLKGTYDPEDLDAANNDQVTPKVVADLARWLGALKRVEGSSVDRISFGGVDYEWQEDRGRVGSNWFDGENSLVSRITKAIGPELMAGANVRTSIMVKDSKNKVNYPIRIMVDINRQLVEK